MLPKEKGIIFTLAEHRIMPWINLQTISFFWHDCQEKQRKTFKEKIILRLPFDNSVHYSDWTSLRELFASPICLSFDSSGINI